MGNDGWQTESGSGREQLESVVAAAAVESVAGPEVNSGEPWRESSGLLL